MNFKLWLKAFRLRTLPLSLAIILAGTSLVFLPNLYVGKNASFGPILSLTLITTLFLQILSNLANDYGDYVKGTDNAQRVGPERSLQGGGITKNQMFRAIVIFSLLSLVSGLALLYLSFSATQFKTALLFLAIGIMCIAAAIKYTMGKGAYGYRALGDLAVLVFFGGVGVLGTLYVQTKYIHLSALFVALAYGMWAVAVLNLNNMRDVENDVHHKKFTLAYYMGFRGALMYQVVLTLVPYLLMFTAVGAHLELVCSLCVLILFPVSTFVIFKIIQVRERKEFDKYLKVQALLTLLNAIILFTCLYLVHE